MIERIAYLVSEGIPIMSGVYLFTALYFIGKFKRIDYQVNFKSMTLHAASFGLFMASALLFMCAFVMYAYFSKITADAYYKCYGIVFICSSLSQVVLCIIFWDLGKKRLS